MKKNILIILIVVLSLPYSVKSLELECPKGPYNNGNIFECYLIDNEMRNYTSLEGTLISGEGINCAVTNTSVGINNISQTNTNILINGQSENNILLNIECNVTSENPVESATTLSIDGTKYVLDNGQSEENLIIRSDFINILPFSNEIIDTKPRDTSNPASLLNNITIDNIDFTFSRLILIYNIQVLNEITDLNINYIPNDEGAIVNIIKPDVLAVGENVIDIYVTSPDGLSTTCYTFKIKRLNPGEEIYYEEKDANLKELTIMGHTITFSPTTYEYDLKIGSEINSLDITAIPNVDTATVEISQTNNIKNNDIIKITVKSKDGTVTNVYKIKIQKEIEEKSYKNYFILGGAGAVVLIIIIFIIINNNNNKKDPLMRIKAEGKKKEKKVKTNLEEIPITTPEVNNQEIVPNTTVNVVAQPENPIQSNQDFNNNTLNVGVNNVTDPNIQNNVFNQPAQVVTPISLEQNQIVAQQPQLEQQIEQQQVVQSVQPQQTVSNINTLETTDNTNTTQTEQQINNLDNTVIIKGQTTNILPTTPDTPKLPNDL